MGFTTVDYHDVKDRLFPNPECIHILWNNVPSPYNFDKLGYDDKTMCCVLLELLEHVDISSISKTHMFNWIYVKGTIEPGMIEITIHPSLK